MRPAAPRFLRTSGQYAATDVNCPGQIATVFVAFAWMGRIFMPSSAGNDKNDPPPATAFSTPARKVATTSHTHCQLTVPATLEKCMKRILFERSACAETADTREPASLPPSSVIEPKLGPQRRDLCARHPGNKPNSRLYK